MEKKTKTFHGKEMYLLGKDAYNIYYYLEAPTWDCGWYWGFGYIEGFRGNVVNDTRQASHQHAEDFMSKWFTEFNGSNPVLSETTFTQAEGWTLSELFKTFYTLKESAELLGRGGSHITTNPLAELLTDKAYTEKINTVYIPAVTAKIIEILI